MFTLRICVLNVFFACFVSLQVLGQATFDQVSAAFKKSYDLEANKKYTDAISALKTVYSADHYELNLRLGWLYYSAGSYTEATQYYTKASEIMPMSIEARLGLAMPLAAQSAWDKVEAQYLAILNSDPNHSTVNYRLGLIYYNKKKYSDAISSLTRVIDLYPFDYDCLNLLGYSYLNSGEKRKAQALFQKALLNRPSDTSAKQGLDAASK